MSWEAYEHTTMELSGLHTLRVIQDQDARNPYEDWDMASHIITLHRRHDFSPNDTKKMHTFGLHKSRYYEGLLGYRDGKDGEEEIHLDTLESVFEFLQKEHGAVVMPLYMYDHSGITVSTSSSRFSMIDSHGWDWGVAGVVFMTADDIKKHISIYRKGFSKKRREEYTRFELRDNGKPRGDKERKTWVEYFNTDTQSWTRDQCWWRNHVRVTEADRDVAAQRIIDEVKDLDRYVTGDVWGVVIDDEHGDEIEGCWGYFGIDYVEKDVIPGLLKDYQLHEEDHESQRERIEAEADEEVEAMIESELPACVLA